MFCLFGPQGVKSGGYGGRARRHVGKPGRVSEGHCPEAVLGTELSISLSPGRPGHPESCPHTLVFWASSSLAQGIRRLQVCFPGNDVTKNFRLLDHTSVKGSR